MFIVYKITNMINGKQYIGITKHSLKRRWQEHVNSANSLNDYYVFHKAIKKYGASNFQLEVLAKDLTKEEAQEKERLYIKQYNTYYLNNKGYNMTFGGECNDHFLGEDAPSAVLTNKQAEAIRNLLRNYDLSYSEIAVKIGLTPELNTLASIFRINYGKTFVDTNIQYPIRPDGRLLLKNKRRGEGNPAAKLTAEQVTEIIEKLKYTTQSQTSIAKDYGVSYNTINLINRCKIWNNLHSYKKNIREEYKKGE